MVCCGGLTVRRRAHGDKPGHTSSDNFDSVSSILLVLLLGPLFFLSFSPTFPTVSWSVSFCFNDLRSPFLSFFVKNTLKSLQAQTEILSLTDLMPQRN